MASGLQLRDLPWPGPERAWPVLGLDDLGPPPSPRWFPLLPGPDATGDTLCTSMGAFICLEASASRVIKAPGPAP